MAKFRRGDYQLETYVGVTCFLINLVQFGAVLPSAKPDKINMVGAGIINGLIRDNLNETFAYKFRIGHDEVNING